MKIKIDEQLSELLKEPFVRSGFDVSTVVEQGLSGLLDTELWPVIQVDLSYWRRSRRVPIISSAA